MTPLQPWKAQDRGGGGALTPSRPEDYGAKRDGTTDDTAAIKACVQAACDAAVADGSYYAEVQFSVGVYELADELTQGGDTKGNALIPLPVFPDTGKKMVLVLKGSEEQNTNWHWNQAAEQDAGVVLRTSVAGTNDATFGPASVIGGPTPQQGYGATTNVWSNMLVVVDGLQISTPQDPHISGFDFAGVAQMHFENGSVLTVAPGPTGHTAPTQTWQFGLRTPQNNNNANSSIGEYTAVAQNYGAYVNEHTVAKKITALYCVAGVEFGDGNGTGHGIVIDHLCVESGDVGIGAVTAGFPTKIDVRSLNFEALTFALVNDPTSRLLGEVRASGRGVTDLLVDAPNGNSGKGVRGAANLKVYDVARQAGAQAAPAIPASATALRNPFWRDALVYVSGGTVTNIAIAFAGGAAQTIAADTTTPVPVLLPAGAYITLTYTAAPTWVWTVL